MRLDKIKYAFLFLRANSEKINLVNKIKLKNNKLLALIYWQFLN